MREILFRGRTIEGKEWVNGSFAVYSSTPFIGAPNSYGTMLWFAVDPETVGQFTGLTDKNGKMIFEGDIVRYVNPDEDVITGSVAFGMHSYTGTHELGFYVEWQKPEWAMNIRDDLGFWINFREIEVIGNIHDQPEFLETT